MIRAHRHPRSRRQAGFSLIDVLLALGVVILISGITLTGVRRTNESNQAKAVGEQIKMIGGAMNTYISLRYDVIVAHQPGVDDVGNPGTAADPGPRSCVWANSPANTVKLCTINSETLRRNGLLPSSFSGYNAFGSTYQMRIRVDTTGAGPAQMEGLAWTEEAYMMDGEERFDLLGQAMLVAGADSGMTRSTPDRVEGFNGAWAEEDMGVSKLGVLAYRSGYATFGYAGYLRTSGTGTGSMLGDINMGNNSIYNIEALKAQNVATEKLRLKKDNAAIVFSDTAAFDVTDESAIAAAAATDPSIGTIGNGLVIRSDVPVKLLAASTGVGGDMELRNLQAADITNTGNYFGNGTITAQQSITSGTRMRAVDGFLAGTTTTAQNKTLVFSQADGGGIYFNVNGSGTSATPRGFKLDTTTAIIRAVGSSIMADGDIRAADDLIADDRVVVGGNEIILDSTVNPVIGAGCVAADAGKIVRSSSGEVAQCFSDGTSYRWRTMGSSIVQIPGGNTTTGPGATQGNSVNINCPAGYSIVTGGYSYASGSPRGTAAISTRVDNDTWRVQAGPTAAYLGTETQTTTFSTYAICSR